VNLSVNIGSLTLRNPVMTASGTFGYGAEYGEFVDLNRLGAVVVKGISREPMAGNPVPRITETPSGMLNSIGLQNVGLNVFLKEKLPYLRRFDVPVIVNILGNSLDDYAILAAELEQGGVSALEINVSCPNVKEGGIAFGAEPGAMADVVGAVRRAVKIPIITKLSPNTGRIPAFAKAAEDAGSDGISLINTLLAMAIDVETRRPKLANTTGGLSGPAIRPVAVRMVWEAARAVKVPVIGMGGIMTGEDAVEFLLAGATAVAVGTASFVRPDSAELVVDGIRAYLERHGLNDIRDLIGGIRV